MRTARILLAAAVASLLTSGPAAAADNQAPVAAADSYTVAQNHVLDVAAPGLLANDSDPDGDNFTLTLFANGSHVQTLGVNPDGSFSYEPVTGYAGPDTFTYTITDSSGATSTANVNITVIANQAPVASDDHYTLDSGMELHVPAPGVLGNDSDPDGDALSIILATDFAHGAHQINQSGALDYVPTSGFLGTDTLTYAVHDGNGAVSAVATVTVTVVAPPSNTGPTPDSTDPAVQPDDGQALLPDTGSEASSSLPIIAGLLTLAGILVLRRARRQASA